MADVSARTPVFSRGSTVLDYWLVHAEGLTVQPLGARVEEVVVTAPVGRAEALIVSSPMTRRRKAIPAEAIAAVEPSAGALLLDPSEVGAGLHIPRPSPERIAATRASAARGGRVVRTQATGAARSTRAGTLSALAWLRPRAARSARFAWTQAVLAGRSTRAGTLSALSWLRPRVVQAARTAAQYTGIAGARTARGVAWVVPRVVEGVRIAAATAGRLVLAAIALAARGTAHAARDLERVAAGTAERRRASLETRRARRQIDSDGAPTRDP